MGRVGKVVAQLFITNYQQKCDFVVCLSTALTLNGGFAITKSNLRGTDLSGTKLNNVDLNFANLTEANLSGAGLSGAKYNTHTQWPAGFDPKEAGAIFE